MQQAMLWLSSHVQQDGIALEELRLLMAQASVVLEWCVLPGVRSASLALLVLHAQSLEKARLQRPVQLVGIALEEQRPSAQQMV